MPIHPFDHGSDPSSFPVAATEADADLADTAAADLPDVEDEPEVTKLRDAWETFVGESTKLWWIATPIAFSIVCLYGINSTTQIFAGHLGNLELSAVAIGLSVISNFSFGFLVSRRFPFSFLSFWFPSSYFFPIN